MLPGARRKRKQLMAALLFAMSCVAGGQWPGARDLAGAQESGTGADRFYGETGHTLAWQFVSFFDLHGGLPLFGYPITEARSEGGYLVQWTQRERLEWHPENAGTPYEVLLGLLGRELTIGLNGPSFRGWIPGSGATSDRSTPSLVPAAHEPQYFLETGHTLG